MAVFELGVEFFSVSERPVELYFNILWNLDVEFQ